MSKKAAIFHGTGANEADFWYDWLRKELEMQGYKVWLPNMPTEEDGFVNLANWQNFFRDHSPSQEYDLVIGHSAGCPHILNLLSKGLIEAKKVVLVAGFITPLQHMTKDHPTFPRDLDTEAVRAQEIDFTFIHSDNDPWGCDHHQGEAMREKLGGTLVIMTQEGHFGSNQFDQPYKEFPLLLAQCLLD